MQAKASNYFHELSGDFEGACYGFYFCELAEYYTREANDELQMLKLLYQSLRALCKPNIPNELIRYIYELKVLVVNGECPPDFGQLDICESTLYTLQYIAASSIENYIPLTCRSRCWESCGLYYTGTGSGIWRGILSRWCSGDLCEVNFQLKNAGKDAILYGIP